MKNNSLLAVFAVVAFGAWGMAAPATAQRTSNDQLLGGGVMSKFSASDVTSMMSDFEITSSLTAYAGGETATMLAATSGGAHFFISLMACDDLSAATGCQRAIIFTAISNSGFAYENLNNFNLGADVTKAMNIGSKNMIVFSAPIFSGGGIGRDNFKLLTALFLNDMQAFVDSQSSSAAEVSFGQGPRPGGKLDNIGSGRTPAPHETSLFSATMTEHALSAAVANSWKIEFLTEQAKAALE